MLLQRLSFFVGNDWNFSHRLLKIAKQQLHLCNYFCQIDISQKKLQRGNSSTWKAAHYSNSIIVKRNISHNKVTKCFARVVVLKNVRRRRKFFLLVTVRRMMAAAKKIGYGKFSGFLEGV